MHNLAVLLAQSTTTSPDYTTVAHWFNAAAARGLADSQFNLAILHENGLGVPKSLPVSYKWFSLAALRGDAEAAKRRDITATHLSPLEIKQAQEEIKVWRALPPDPAANDPKAAGDAWKAKQETSSNDVNINTERAEFAVKRKTAPNQVAPKPAEAEVAEPTEATSTATPEPPATNVVRPAKRQVVKPKSAAEVEKLLTQLGYDPSKLKKAPAPKPAEPVDDNATN
jgi:TPR repeat protein